MPSSKQATTTIHLAGQVLFTNYYDLRSTTRRDETRITTSRLMTIYYDYGMPVEDFGNGVFFFMYIVSFGIRVEDFGNRVVVIRISFLPLQS